MPRFEQYRPKRPCENCGLLFFGGNGEEARKLCPICSPHSIAEEVEVAHRNIYTCRNCSRRFIGGRANKAYCGPDCTREYTNLRWEKGSRDLGISTRKKKTKRHKPNNKESVSKIDVLVRNHSKKVEEVESSIPSPSALPDISATLKEIKSDILLIKATLNRWNRDGRLDYLLDNMNL